MKHLKVCRCDQCVVEKVKIADRRLADAIVSRLALTALIEDRGEVERRVLQEVCRVMLEAKPKQERFSGERK